MRKPRKRGRGVGEKNVMGNRKKTVYTNWRRGVGLRRGGRKFTRPERIEFLFCFCLSKRSGP